MPLIYVYHDEKKNHFLHLIISSFKMAVRKTPKLNYEPINKNYLIKYIQDEAPNPAPP